MFNWIKKLQDEVKKVDEKAEAKYLQEKKEREEKYRKDDELYYKKQQERKIKTFGQESLNEDAIAEANSEIWRLCKTERAIDFYKASMIFDVSEETKNEIELKYGKVALQAVKEYFIKKKIDYENKVKSEKNESERKQQELFDEILYYLKVKLPEELNLILLEFLNDMYKKEWQVEEVLSQKIKSKSLFLADRKIILTKFHKEQDFIREFILKKRTIWIKNGIEEYFSLKVITELFTEYQDIHSVKIFTLQDKEQEERYFYPKEYNLLIKETVYQVIYTLASLRSEFIEKIIAFNQSVNDIQERIYQKQRIEKTYNRECIEAFLSIESFTPDTLYKQIEDDR